MTTYQSQTVHTEDREGNSLAFSTVNLDGEEAVLKAAVAVELPDGQQVSMNVLYDAEDVRGLMAYLHDNFGGRAKTTVKAEDLQDPGGWPAVIEPQPATGAGWSAASSEDLQYYAEQDAAWQPKPGDTVHVVTATVNEHQTGTVVPIEPEGRQCPVIYSGLQCAGPEGHEGLHGFVQYGPAEEPFPQTAVLPQNDAGAVPPPADTQGAAYTPQSGVPAPDQSAAESATGAGNTGTAPASTSEKPKRKRRTKLEIAFDTAKDEYDRAKFGGTPEQAATAADAYKDAYKALVAKDPGNSRLNETAAPANDWPLPGESQPPADLQTGPAFAPEQPVTGGPWSQNPDGSSSFNVLDAAAQSNTANYQAAGQMLIDAANSAGYNVPAFEPGQAPELGQTQLSPEEQQAATGFPCPVQSSDGRPCLRPYGHELQTATNPQAKPHVYATVPSQLPTTPLVESPLTGPSYPAPGQQEGNQAFLAGRPLSFQVPPTPQATAPHPDTNLQPPAPAAPSWAEPV